MQHIFEQITDATASLSSEAWALIGGALALELILGAVFGFCLRRPKSAQLAGSGKKGQGAGVLGACGAAEFACKAAPQFRVLSLSADIETITGYGADVLTESDAFLRMLDERDAQQFTMRARSAVQDERPFIMDARYEDADGRSRWMHVRAEPVRDGRGRVTGLSGIVREVTEQKRLAADAADAWARFHALADSTPAMLWVLDANADCRASNTAAERFSGTTGDQLLGQGWTKHFEGEERAALIRYVMRSFEECQSLRRETQMIDAKGRTRTVALSTTVARDEQGDPTGIVVTGKDITDLSETDRQLDRLRKIVDASEHHIAVLAPDMRVAMLNRSSKVTLGLDERDTPDELALWHVVTKDTSDQMRSEGVKACAEHEAWRGQGRIRTGEETSALVEICMIPFGDGWHGMIARPIEHELRREADAEMDRRRLAVARGAMERLAKGGWAPGRAPQRITEAVAKHYTHLRTTYASFGEDGRITTSASDGPAWMGSAVGRALKLNPRGTLAKRLSDGEIVRVEDVWNEPELEASLLALEETAARSVVAVMVDPGSRDSGLLMFEKPEAGPWPQDETETLRMIAGVLSVALMSERDRAERMTAEARIAEQTERWRTERERSEELSSLASDHASKADRLQARLDKVDSAWAGGLAELARRAGGAFELAGAARSEGLTDLAENLEELASEAEHAEIAGRIVSRTLRPEYEVCEPPKLLRLVGERFVKKAKARGVSLKITQSGPLPDTFEADPRLLRLACCELLELALERCPGREMVAAASMSGDSPHASLVVRVTGGHVTEPSQTHLGAPTGLSFLRQLAETLGGRLETTAQSGSTELALILPVAEPVYSEAEDAGRVEGGAESEGAQDQPEEREEAA